jgi:predicted ATP-dependent protease
MEENGPENSLLFTSGSINQKGEVQAIGGVNQKIEGFFQLCKNRGLTSKQGVIIPASNIQNLMLDDEIIQAVREGLFHVFAVKNVDEAIEILTGMKAGKLLDDGTYEPGTIKAQVDEKI